jgi:GT2 family glycosyltransferase
MTVLDPGDVAPLHDRALPATFPLAAAHPLRPVDDQAPRPGGARPRVDGKFLAVGDRRLWVRGVTYGTFAPDAAGDRFPAAGQVARDFAAMAAAGVTAVRLYTVPPRRVLDAAQDAGLWVLVGLPWTQHVTFLADRRGARAIAGAVGAAVGPCAGHPAVLGYAVGNEIPAAVVRWHGRRRVERFLDRLCRAVRAADPGALATYVNFPSTEYLRVAAADFLSFNVYLEDPREMAAYLARLQSLAGERPLLLAEVGLDSRRNGSTGQAASVARQIGLAFRGGCVGTFVFAWTDEWHRGDDAVLDWDFGLTDRVRRAKPALRAVTEAFAGAPPRPDPDAPLISVVVCTFNGAATLRDCLEGVRALRYPHVEAIVVDDGSTDASAAIAHELEARVISTPNRGLSEARNTGLEAAAGEIVAYLDDDARPDADWLTYLAATFAATDHAGIGGPNVPPAEETGVASCVANAPGGPVHVLVSDTEAEHLPGCNMAFRRSVLLELGGFDPQFRVAGDDVDLCWRLQEAGHTLGFHPAAMVWHRRRSTIRRFWRQQRGYGRAEALLERKWPEKYNMPGHPTWGGRLYGRGVGGLLRRSRVYHGVWGTGAFQPEIAPAGGHLIQMTAAPEWYIVIGLLLCLGLLGAAWAPLQAGLPLAAAAAAAAVGNAAAGTRRATFGPEAERRPRRLVLQAVTFVLHLLQPAARLAGRLQHGLVPWRRPRRWRFAVPTPRARRLWSERWCAPEQRLRLIEVALRAHGERVRVGGPTDRWDLQVAGGALGAARLLTAVEEHGRGRQLTRCRVRPRVPRALAPVVVVLAAAGGLAAAQAAWLAAVILLFVAVALATAAVCECGIATAAALRAVAGAQDAVGASASRLELLSGEPA